MTPSLLTKRRRLAWTILALVGLTQSGCVWLAAGAAAGAAAAGYAYYKGEVPQIYSASLEDTWAATRTSVTELGMPVMAEERETASRGYIKTQLNNGAPVHIYLEQEESKFPVEGQLTRVSIRVATFGDHDVSDRLHAQISTHLTPLVAPPGQPAATGQPPGGNAISPAAGWQSVGPPAPPTTATSPPSTPPPPLASSDPSRGTAPKR